MEGPRPGVAVLFGPARELVSHHSPPALLQRLARAGLPARRIRDGGGVVLRLSGDDWDGENLAALVARARARPGEMVWLANEQASAAVAGPDADRQPRTPLPPPPAPPATVLLDRDGTIMVDRRYLADPAGVELLPAAASGLGRLAALGLRLVVLTNQSGVGRGLFTALDLAAVHQRLQELLRREGVALDGIFACLHHPDDGCACRKPAPGLAREAEGRLGLDLRRAVVVGDQPADLGLARELGLTGVLLAPPGSHPLTPTDPQPDYAVEDLEELADLLEPWTGTGAISPEVDAARSRM